jgi:hypothetical protein
MKKHPYAMKTHGPPKESKITPYLGLGFGAVVLVFFLIFEHLNPPPAIVHPPAPIVAPVARPTATCTPTPSPTPTVAPTPAPAPTTAAHGHRRPLPRHGVKFVCRGGEAVGLERCSQ